MRSWLTRIEPISRHLDKFKCVHLPGPPYSAYCEGDTIFFDRASPNDAGHRMHSDQYYLSPDRHRCAVHGLVPPYSLLVDKVEDDRTDSRRGYVSAELL